MAKDGWNTSNYQYDGSNYNYDSVELVPFENEYYAYLSVCSLENYSAGAISSLGNVSAGSVQNVNLSGMDSSKMCLSSIGSTIGNTLDRMGRSLNARFEAEKEDITLFGDDKDQITDLAGMLRGKADQYSSEMLDELSSFGKTNEDDDFGVDLSPESLSTDSPTDSRDLAFDVDSSTGGDVTTSKDSPTDSSTTAFDVDGNTNGSVTPADEADHSTSGVQPYSLDELKKEETQIEMSASRERAEYEKWKILQDTQQKAFEIQQDVTVNNAKEKDKMYSKWDEFVRQ